MGACVGFTVTTIRGEWAVVLVNVKRSGGRAWDGMMVLVLVVAGVAHFITRTVWLRKVVYIRTRYSHRVIFHTSFANHS